MALARLRFGDRKVHPSAYQQLQPLRDKICHLPIILAINE
jgi:hypothetical protein